MKYVQFVRSVVSSRIPHFLSYDAYLSKSVVIDTLQAVAEKKKHFQKTPDKCRQTLKIFNGETIYLYIPIFLFYVYVDTEFQIKKKHETSSFESICQ